MTSKADGMVVSMDHWWNDNWYITI